MRSLAGRRWRMALAALAAVLLGAFPSLAQVSSSASLQLRERQEDAGDLLRWLALDEAFGLEGIWDSIDIELDIDPLIVASPTDGTLTLLWAKASGTRYVIATASRPLGGEWGAMSIVYPTAEVDRRRPAAAFDQAGHLHVIWLRAADSERVVEHSAKVIGLWTLPKAMSPLTDVQSADVQYYGTGSVLVTYWTRGEMVQVRMTNIASTGGSDDIDPTITFETEEIMHFMLPP